MANARDRELQARQAKLEHMQEQIASGELVIRTMTAAEKQKWAKQRRALDTNSTPEQRARRAASLENRRRRQARFE